MKIIEYKKLSKQNKKLLSEAKKISKKSVIGKNSFVGAVIVGSKRGVYKGATVARTRAIGSTCSERMAMDQLYFSGKEKPKAVFIIGTFERDEWKNDFICTPCGVCLEMFLESMKHFSIDNLNFICSSWDMTKILKCTMAPIKLGGNEIYQHPASHKVYEYDGKIGGLARYCQAHHYGKDFLG